MKSERLVNGANHTSYIYIADKAVSQISVRLLTDVSGQNQNEKEKEIKKQREERGEESSKKRKKRRNNEKKKIAKQGKT